MKKYAAHTTRGKVATHKNAFPKRKPRIDSGDDLRAGETKVIRLNARRTRKACCECHEDTGSINMVLTRGRDFKSETGVMLKTFSSKNYCDRCLPGQYRPRECDMCDTVATLNGDRLCLSCARLAHADHGGLSVAARKRNR